MIFTGVQKQVQCLRRYQMMQNSMQIGCTLLTQGLPFSQNVEKLDRQIYIGSREPNRLTTFTCCWLALLAGWLLGGWLGRSAGWVDLPAVVRSTLLHFRIVAGPSGKIWRSDISGHVEELFVRFGSKSRQQFWYVFSPLQFNTRCLKFDRYQPLAAW